MNEADFQNLKSKKKVEEVSPKQPDSKKDKPVSTTPTLDDYIDLFFKFRKTKQHVTSAPTFVPQDFFDSIQFYDTGGVRRLYLYFNGSWRYVVLT